MTAKFYFLPAILLLLFVTAYAQQRDVPLFPQKALIKGQHVIYGEMFGPGILASIHYDVRFKPGHLGLGARIGIGYAPAFTDKYIRHSRNNNMNNNMNVPDEEVTHYYPAKLTIPFGINYVLTHRRKPAHLLELGFGATYMTGDAVLFDMVTTRHTWLLFASVEYRHYYPKKHLMWKTGFTPTISLMDPHPYPLPYVSLAVGYIF
jgi:hypothetical protein